MAMIDIDWRPDRRKLREFGFFGAGGCVLLLGQLFWKHKLLFFAVDPPNVNSAAGWLTGVGLLFLLLALIWPPALRPVYLVLTAVTLPIGFVVSHVAMALIFYLIFGGVGLVFRLIGRDLLERRYDPDAESYWSPRRPAEGKDRYFRQF